MHHEFSQKRTENDRKCITQIVTYISERGNPFDSKDQMLKNLATGSAFDEDTASFYMNCISYGKENYQKFWDRRLSQKSVKLFDTITKTRSNASKGGKRHRTPDVKKETIDFLRTVDYARLRQFDVADLLEYEVSSTSFYLTKDGNLRKSQKSELAREMKNMIEKECQSTVPESNLKSIIVIDFMAYARKIPTKKMNLKTYKDFYNVLWNTFSNLLKSPSRIDIIFDLYLQQSIKEDERSRRSKNEPIDTKIMSLQQQLPIEMDRFWSSSDNKMRFQQSFISWMISNCDSEIPVFLGGAHTNDITSCVKLHSREVSFVDSLKNDHEEADDRMMYHLNLSIRECGMERAIIASADTDVFICALYHFKRWIYAGLKELWIFSGRSGSTTAFPIHCLAEQLEDDVIDILPAVHALTGKM